MIKPEATVSLNPETLKLRRKRADLSQQGLADKSKISKTTIGRWECGKQIKNIHPSSRDRLCRALGVRWEELTQPPEPANLAFLPNRVSLKGSIAGSARTALTYMQLRYGLREETIIDLAPLAFLILAERSLQTRKAALDETVQALEAATGDAYRRLPYMRGAFYVAHDDDWIAKEDKSIEEREVYEEYVYEGEEMSPFVDFLEKELKEIKKELKKPDPLLVHPIELRSGYRDAPDYAIPVESLAQALGLDATDEADRCVLERIQDGRINLRKAFEKRAAEDYRHWLAEKYQAVEEEIKSRLPKLTFKIRPPQDGAGGSVEGDIAANIKEEQA